MLRCVRDVKTDLGSFKAGDVVEMTPEAEGWLLRDSGAFELVTVEVTTAAPEAPEVDKQIKRRTRA